MTTLSAVLSQTDVVTQATKDIVAASTATDLTPPAVLQVDAATRKAARAKAITTNNAEKRANPTKIPPVVPTSAKPIVAPKKPSPQAGTLNPKVKGTATPVNPTKSTSLLGGQLAGKTIKILVPGGGKRANTKAAALFALYQDGMTVRQYLEAGGTLVAVKWDADARRKLIALS